MLNRINIIAFSVALVVALWLVAIQRQETLRASIPLENRTAMVELPTDDARAASQNPVPQRARISPLPGEIFLRSIDLNMDEDEDFEQCIIAKESAASSMLLIIIADFNPALGTYTRYFQATITEAKADSLMIQPIDVTGDGLADLIVQGLDNANNQVMTIFRRLAHRGYTRVFAQSGTMIVLQEPTNTKNYEAASILVQTPYWSQNRAVRTIYTWNSRLQFFEKAGESPFQENSQEALGIPGSDAHSFELWLNRLWTRSDASDSASDSRSFFLDASKNELYFGEARMQQKWIIKSADRSDARLYLTCSTSESSDLDRVVTIEAKSRDTILIGIIDQQISQFRRDEGWSGVYTARIPPKESAPNKPSISTQSFFDMSEFYGRYLGSDDSVLILEPSRTVLVLSKKYYEGIAKVYDYSDIPVLDFQQILANGLGGTRLLFAIRAETAQDESIIRLSLFPASIESTGVRIEYAEPYIFIKTS